MSSPFIIIDEIESAISAVETKIDTVDGIVDTINSNVNTIKTATAASTSASASGTLSQKLSWIGNTLIGATNNTGGTASAGTVMAKLNAILNKVNTPTGYCVGPFVESYNGGYDNSVTKTYNYPVFVYVNFVCVNMNEKSLTAGTSNTSWALIGPIAANTSFSLRGSSSSVNGNANIFKAVAS